MFAMMDTFVPVELFSINGSKDFYKNISVESSLQQYSIKSIESSQVRFI